MTSPTVADRQLLIIGNGFDLSCGLRSSFKDFIGWRFNHLENKDGVCKPNIWDVVFKNNSKTDANWCDIESAIAGWAGGMHSAAITMLLDKAESPKRWWFKNKYHNNPHNDEEFRFAADAIGIEGALDIAQHYRYLIQSLRSLETSFVSYMNEALSCSDSYQNNAFSIAYNLLFGDNDDADYSAFNVSLLNFNYTEPLSPSMLDALHIDIERNIHGKLNSNEIIFGIDGTELMSDPFALPFTKTYRLIQLNRPNSRCCFGRDLGLSDHMMCIKFFGHSLATADHSYFQAIFDAVDLYGSDTCLEFYYRTYGQKNEEQIKLEQVRSIIGLLTRYSKTLDNEYRGKNLIHRLLLENRLKIIKLNI